MSGIERIGPGIHLVGGPGLTDNRDALTYLIEDSGELALIDSGAGPGYRNLIANIAAAGQDPARLKYVIATHAHIDHIGALADLARDFGPDIAAHEADAHSIESGNSRATAADWYGLTLKPVQVTIRLTGRENRLRLGGIDLICLHAPGHTPGSMVVYLDREGRRYLFGQDIHGPFDPAFGSDIATWRESMKTLLELKADLLAEGHYGVFDGSGQVAAFIQGFLTRFSE